MAPPCEYRTCIVKDTAHRACNLFISGEGSARQGAALVLGEVPEDAVVICVVGSGVSFALGVQANPLILVVAMVVSDNVSFVELCVRMTTLGRGGSHRRNDLGTRHHTPSRGSALHLYWQVQP